MILLEEFSSSVRSMLDKIVVILMCFMYIYGYMHFDVTKRLLKGGKCGPMSSPIGVQSDRDQLKKPPEFRYTEFLSTTPLAAWILITQFNPTLKSFSIVLVVHDATTGNCYSNYSC